MLSGSRANSCGGVEGRGRLGRRGSTSRASLRSAPRPPSKRCEYSASNSKAIKINTCPSLIRLYVRRYTTTRKSKTGARAKKKKIFRTYLVPFSDTGLSRAKHFLPTTNDHGSRKNTTKTPLERTTTRYVTGQQRKKGFSPFSLQPPIYAAYCVASCCRP